MSRLIRKPAFNVMCLDPSIREFGVAIVANHNIDNKPKVLLTRCIKTENHVKKLRTRAGDDRIRRLNEIGVELNELIDEYNVSYIVSELPHGSQSASAAITLGMVTGLVQGIQNFKDVPVEWYSEADSKKALLGKSSAAKIEIIEAIKKKYDVAWPTIKYKKEAIADALAIHNVALRNSHVLRTMKRS